MSIFKRKDRVGRQLGNALLEDAIARVEQPIPAGTRIYTSDSPKVKVAHVKSALHPGAVCEAMSLREGPWLGIGSDEEKRHAALLRLCSRCAIGDYGEAAS